MIASVITLGCKVNEYESQSILNQLKSVGYEIQEGLVVADVYVVNTCAVTNVGEKKSRQVLSKILKLNSNAKIIVIGCAVQNNPTQFLKNENVIALTGNYGKHDIINFINKQNKVVPQLENVYINMARTIQTRTRQYIKIQDGCDNFCTYCLIPYLRGRSRSRDLSDIIDEIKSTNAKEIVLTGINMSDYKIDGKLALNVLVKEIDKLNIRFRISSIECNVLNDEMLLALKSCKNFCPHFHLSLQSACNDTLKRMNRKYTIEQFKLIVAKIKDMFEYASISTDIIVGFKGETEQEFNNTCKNLDEIEFSFMHIFPYSVRSGTAACKLSGDVPTSESKKRVKILQEKNEQFKQKFYNKNKNTIHKMLVEETDNQYALGYTENYIYTYLNKQCKVGDIVEVKLLENFKDGMKGEIYGR